MTYTGTVKWFNPDKGYGFIKPDSGKRDIFVHISALQAADLDNLNDNQKVEYQIIEEKGKKSAGNIKLL
jgi:CspA family cold shock protein